MKDQSDLRHVGLNILRSQKVRSGLDMAEEREVGGGDAAVTRREQFEENEGNQEKSMRPNGPIVVSNHPPPSGLKTAVPVTIPVAPASSSDAAGWQAPINSFKLAAANCTESRGLLPMEEHLDVFRQKPVRVSVKVNVPVAEHPKVRVFCFLPHSA